MVNILACFPYQPENKAKFRIPTVAEAKACRPRVVDTIEIFDPQLVILAGKTAKKFYPYSETKQYPTFEIDHPSFIQRNGGLKSLVYQRNLLLIRDHLEETFPKWQHGKKLPRKKPARSVSLSGRPKKA
jgi:uracil-DNA glycosylase